LAEETALLKDTTELKAVARLWHGFGKALARLWHGFGKALARLWQGFGKALAWLWQATVYTYILIPSKTDE
jgi:hypothetical protein